MSDPDRLYWDENVEQGRAALTRRDGAQWELGDLALKVQITYGERDFQRYAAEVGVDSDTLRRYRSVSKAFESGIRIPDLSWTHHMVLSGHPEREDWLRRSQGEGWSVAQLREALAEDAAPARTEESCPSEVVQRLQAEQQGSKRSLGMKAVPTFDGKIESHARSLAEMVEQMADAEPEYRPHAILEHRGQQLVELGQQMLEMARRATG